MDPTTRRSRSSSGWHGPSVALLVLLLIAVTIAGRMLGKAFDQGFDHASATTQSIGLLAALVGWILLLGWLIVGTMRLLPVALGSGAAIVVFGAVMQATAGRSWMFFIWAAGVLVIGFGLIRRTLRSVRARERQGVKETGRLTTATVAELDPPQPSTGASRGVITIATFEFTDSEGRQRFVRRPLRLPRGIEIATGTTTQLWYDGQDPRRDRSIVVELSERYPFPRR